MTIMSSVTASLYGFYSLLFAANLLLLIYQAVRKYVSALSSGMLVAFHLEKRLRQLSERV